jgi:ketosteroid isomerase-like protein
MLKFQKHKPYNKTIIKTTLKITALVVFLCIGQITLAQEEEKKSFNEVVTQNPTAEEDIKVVTDYLDAVVNNKMDIVESLLSDEYALTGPSNGETSTKAEEIADWKEANKRRTNQKNEYVVNTWRVLDGNYKGDWVSIWGTYTFTENGTEIVLPYQYTAMVEDGKIQGAAVYFDNLAIATAMGYTLTPPKKE